MVYSNSRKCGRRQHIGHYKTICKIVFVIGTSRWWKNIALERRTWKSKTATTLTTSFSITCFLITQTTFIYEGLFSDKQNVGFIVYNCNDTQNGIENHNSGLNRTRSSSDDKSSHEPSLTTITVQTILDVSNCCIDIIISLFNVAFDSILSQSNHHLGSIPPHDKTRLLNLSFQWK